MDVFFFTFIARSSHRRCSVRKDVLRNLTKFTEKHLCQSLFLMKLQAFIKKRLRHRCFPVSFAKFLRTPFLQNPSGRLLLHIAQFNSFHPFLVIFNLFRNFYFCCRDNFLLTQYFGNFFGKVQLIVVFEVFCLFDLFYFRSYNFKILIKYFFWISFHDWWC